MFMDSNVRWKWLKGMFILTIIHAGGSGLGMILIPSAVQSFFGWPSQDPIVFGRFSLWSLFFSCYYKPIKYFYFISTDKRRLLWVKD